MGRGKRMCRVVVVGLAASATALPVRAQTIIDEWGAVKAPRPPELKPVVIDPSRTALLVLDFTQQNCNAERRPRCIASIPKVQRLLAEARQKGLQIIHSQLSGAAAPPNVLSVLAAKDGEPVVTSGPDKFIGTELEQILAARSVRRLLIVGTAANGAVLHTASSAAFRGFDVVVPVDGMSASDLYAEQYTAWHLANGPRTSERVTLTTMDTVSY